jgi:hypothetical protein
VRVFSTPKLVSIALRQCLGAYARAALDGYQADEAPASSADDLQNA